MTSPCDLRLTRWVLQYRLERYFLFTGATFIVSLLLLLTATKVSIEWNLGQPASAWPRSAAIFQSYAHKNVHWAALSSRGASQEWVVQMRDPEAAFSFFSRDHWLDGESVRLGEGRMKTLPYAEEPCALTDVMPELIKANETSNRDKWIVAAHGWPFYVAISARQLPLDMDYSPPFVVIYWTKLLLASLGISLMLSVLTCCWFRWVRTT